MTFTAQIKKWFTKFEKYKVTYKDGFIRLSNLANSPFTLVESFDKMPFCKHNRKKSLLTAESMFINAQTYYSELEEGLWILISDLEYKKNIEMTNIYDKSLPMDYHFLNLHYNTTTLKSKSMLMNGMVLTDKTWSIFKAGNATSDCHFKGAHENNITVYFSKKWLDTQIKKTSHFANSSIDRLFQSDNTYILLPDNNKDSHSFYADFLALAEHNEGGAKNKEIEALITLFFKQFISKSNGTIANYDFKLSGTDRKYIQKAEKYLIDNLLHSFPGIEQIAEKVGVSPTKLKNDFKAAHTQSIYQYYRHHQMTLANKLLAEKDTTVKEVANLLGYENASKFAAVFKEQFGVQPSAVLSK